MVDTAQPNWCVQRLFFVMMADDRLRADYVYRRKWEPEASIWCSPKASRQRYVAIIPSHGIESMVEQLLVASSPADLFDFIVLMLS